MKNLILLLTVIFVSSFYVTGQVHQISLVEEEFQFNEFRSYDIRQVINATEQPHSIGFVQKGISNKKRPAVFKLGFEKELETLFDKSLLKLGQAQPILIKFNEFKIWEKTKMSSEYAYVTIELEAYVITEEGYKYVSSFESSFQSKGMDVTSKHEENIFKALEIILEDLSSIDILAQSNDQPTVSIEELKTGPIRQPINVLPISSAKSINKGIYKNFDEFSNNAPSVTDGFIIKKKARNLKEWRDTYDFTLIDSSSGKKIVDNVWGFSDGEYAYIYFAKEFYQIEITSDDISFHSKHQSTDGIGTAAIPAGVMGGAIGGALAGGIAAMATKVQKLKLRINRGGTITQVDLPDQGHRETVNVFIYRPHKKEHSSGIEVRNSNEELLDSLEPGEYLEVETNSGIGVVLYKAGLVDSGELVELQVATDEKQIYIEVSHLEKSKSQKPVIKLVDDDIGEYYINRFSHQKEL